MKALAVLSLGLKNEDGSHMFNPLVLLWIKSAIKMTATELREKLYGAALPSEITTNTLVLGAALKNSLRKNVFKHIFFSSLQSCRYGVLYKYSSRGFLKIYIFHSHFFLFLLGFGGFSFNFFCWWALQTPCRLHPTSITYVCKLF